MKWEIDANGDLVVTIDADEQARLREELWPHKQPPWEEAERRGWGEIELDWYRLMDETEGWRLWHNQPYIACWGGPLIAEIDDRNRLIRAWTDEKYVYYESPAGIDTLAKTGRCVWSKVDQVYLEEEGED